MSSALRMPSKIHEDKQNRIIELQKQLLIKDKQIQELKNMLYVKQIQIEELMHNDIKKDQLNPHLKVDINRIMNKKIMNKNEETLKQINEQIEKKYQVLYGKYKIQNSSTIKTTKNYKKLINFFTKNINSLKVIFKASEHNFSMKKYQQICGLETNTIIICLNQYDKIIGGYTPLHFDAGITKLDYYPVSDPSMSSFVFSITSDEKFPLQRKQKAIFRFQKQNLISFGYSFFVIGNNANTSNSSRINTKDQNYIDSEQLILSTQKYLNNKICGDQEGFFKIKQWEVIKVQFK